MRLARGSISSKRSDMGSPWGLEAQPARREGAENRHKAARWRKQGFRLTGRPDFWETRDCQVARFPVVRPVYAGPPFVAGFAFLCSLSPEWLTLPGRDSAR